MRTRARPTPPAYPPAMVPFGRLGGGGSKGGLRWRYARSGSAIHGSASTRYRQPFAAVGSGAAVLAHLLRGPQGAALGASGQRRWPRGRVLAVSRALSDWDAPRRDGRGAQDKMTVIIFTRILLVSALRGAIWTDEGASGSGRNARAC